MVFPGMDISVVSSSWIGVILVLKVVAMVVDNLKMFCLNEKLFSYNRLDSCRLDTCIDGNKSDNFFKFMSRKGFLNSVKSCMLDTHTGWRQLTDQ